MRPVAVVADTTHYLPRDLVAASGIHEVSLYVNWQGRQDREADLPDFDAYYEYLRTAADLPTTSQPSVGDFLAVYEPLVADGRRRGLDSHRRRDVGDVRERTGRPRPPWRRRPARSA